ncbi:MAG: hypothetical protein NT019_02260 [Candidatus Adlerbacteria bacterium]|nr:hypothetical protein [Candidatus Adlerbacteria bacterium]
MQKILHLLAIAGIISSFLPYSVAGKTAVPPLVVSAPIPPTASFDGRVTSLRADPTLAGSVAQLQTPLTLSITSLATHTPVFLNPVSVVQNRWSAHVFPPLSTGTYALSLLSGTTTLATSTLTIGLRSLPTVEPVDSLPPYDVADGRLMRFVVRAGSSGPVGISQISFATHTTGASVGDIGLYVFADAAYSRDISTTTATTTPLNSSLANPTSDTFAIVPDTSIEIPAGTSYYFELDGTVTPTDTTYSVDTVLLGDTFKPLANATDQASTSNFVWSPNTYGTSATTSEDWLNAKILSMPTSGFTEGRSNSPIPVLPTCSVTSDVTVATSGKPVTVSWTGTDTTYVLWSDGTRDTAQGSRTFTNLAASRTYVLTFYNQYGNAPCSINLEVPIVKVAAVVATSTPTTTLDSLLATPPTGTLPLAVTFTASVNNAKSCAALTYSLGYGDGSGTSTVSVGKNVCKAQSAVFAHTYTIAGTYVAGLYQKAGTSSAQLIQKQTIVVKAKTSLLLDAASNIAGVAATLSGPLWHALQKFWQRF